MLVVGLATITLGLEPHAASQALNQRALNMGPVMGIRGRCGDGLESGQRANGSQYEAAEFGANRGHGDVLERHRY